MNAEHLPELFWRKQVKQLPKDAWIQKTRLYCNSFQVLNEYWVKEGQGVVLERVGQFLYSTWRVKLRDREKTVWKSEFLFANNSMGKHIAPSCTCKGMLVAVLSLSSWQYLIIDSNHKKENVFSLCYSGNYEGLQGSRDFGDMGNQETAIKTSSRFCFGRCWLSNSSSKTAPAAVICMRHY